MKFNFISYNLSLLSCILDKESLILLYNKSLSELISFVKTFPVNLSYFKDFIRDNLSFLSELIPFVTTDPVYLSYF
jgi:hypothetical protein